MDNNSLRYVDPQLGAMLLFRTASYVGIAILALLIPQTGENRFVLAAVAGLILPPIVIFLDLKFHTRDRRWVDPLADILVVVSLIHLVPQVWYPALCIGLIVSLAPSISLHPSSNRIYAIYAAVLLGGMSLAGWIHDVEEWWISVLVALVVYPSVIFYAGWQVRRADLLRERAQFVQTIRRLAKHVSHNLNNSLAGIVGHAELAAEGLASDHVARKDLAEVIAAAERTSVLSQQLQSFAYDQRGDCQVVNLEAELTGLVSLLDSIAPANVNVDLVCTHPSISVIGNRSQLQSVLLNIILSAIEASTSDSEQGFVEVTLQQREQSDCFWAEVLITHSHAGPPPWLTRTLARMFSASGVGPSGLAYAGRLAREHDGDIRVDLSDDQIATITLKLPLAPTRDTTVEPTDAIGQTGQVLLVDDDPQVRNAVGRMLSDMGFSVSDAASADEAMDLFVDLEEALRFAVMDLNMPGKDGWTCIDEMRVMRPDLPVIVISGYDPDESGRAGIDGRMTYLSKPFSRAQLRHAVAEVNRLASAYTA